MSAELRFRQIHLDFHTSEHIDGIGADFDPDQFVASLRRGNVDSVTVFARCHHGWSYYPSEVFPPHPHLEREDLLGDMVTACRDADINVPIYVTVQWDERSAREHPEWRIVPPHQGEGSSLGQLDAVWHTLCLSNRDYVDLVAAQAREVVERYRPDGIFFDIVGVRECVCRNCLARMEATGRDAEKSEDRRATHREWVFGFYRATREAIAEVDPGCRIFYNSGHIAKGERDRWPYFSHLELESLPTGGWGYDHFPVSARYAVTLGMEYLGMTGKFHTTWGEFGGFKRPVALEYECALMIANGARCSVGDQLHPRGAMDPATYDAIAPAYARVAEIEEWLAPVEPIAECAVLSAEATGGEQGWAFGDGAQDVDAGAARVLLETGRLFDVIDASEDFGRYPCLILPDSVRCDETLAAKLGSYREGGGKLLLTGRSGTAPDGDRFALDLGLGIDAEVEVPQPTFVVAREGLDDDLPASPFVVYERPLAVRSATDRGVLAETRAPYFQRSWWHFCSHQHSPPRPERFAAVDALIAVDDATIYAPYPLFLEYYRTGQPLVKYLLRGALDRLLGTPRVRTSLPSNGRVTLMRQEGRHVLHLVYAQTQLRGSAHPFHGKNQKMEILEDAVPLREVECAVRLDAEPSRIHSPVAGRDYDFEWRDGRARFVVPELAIHDCVVIED